MRIAIVNDTPMIVEMLRRIITSVPGYDLAWLAYNGKSAVDYCARDAPDLILMDMIMPEMDGVQATRVIMQQSPCAILIVTADIKKNSGKIFEAMGYGALDVVSTPIMGIPEPEHLHHLLLKTIASIGIVTGTVPPKWSSTYPGASNDPSIIHRLSQPPSNLPPLIIIGASTGGPKALATVLRELPSNFEGSIVIIQHLDVHFSSGLAKWLNQQTPLSVVLASEGDTLTASKVLLAGTNDHLALRPNLTLTYTKKPENYPYRPSIDVFCQSVAQYWTRKGMAVLLTGMGRDGAMGLKKLRRRGWHTIAQDKQSCVVYGMPKAAVEMEAATEILSLSKIASTLIKRVRLIA